MRDWTISTRARSRRGVEREPLGWAKTRNGSVVNEWGRSHDVKNLFIVDGSLFVTSAGVNPTCTIQALALYVADNMKQRLATLFD